MGDLRRRASNLVVLCDRGPSLETLRDLPHATRFVAYSNGLLFARRRADVYMAPRGHLSALGSLVVSRELAALLTGSRRLSAPSISYTGTRHRRAFERVEPLSHFERVSIGANGAPLGVVVAGGERPWRVVSFRSPMVASLLDVSDRSRLAFIPVSRPLSGREPVHITVNVSAGSVRFAVGRLVADTTVLGWMRRRAQPGDRAPTEWTVDWAPDTSPLELRLEGPSAPRDVQLWIGDTPVLHGVPSADADGDESPNVLRLEPIGSPLLGVRGDPQQSLHSLQAPGCGLVELILERIDGTASRVPVRELRITEHQLHGLGTSIEHPIPLAGP